MSGREEKKNNDLFFVCGLIEYISRKTKNNPAEIVHKLGKERIIKIYEYADVYHSDNIDRVSEDFISEWVSQMGNLIILSLVSILYLPTGI